MSPGTWAPLRPDLARALSDARLEVHHAAQLATAFGISYLRPQPDDSHTNLEWLDEQGALASNSVGDVRIELRVAGLGVAVGGRELGLRGRTISEAAAWIRERLSEAGLDATAHGTR
jgi:hypothetical protein